MANPAEIEFGKFVPAFTGAVEQPLQGFLGNDPLPHWKKQFFLPEGVGKLDLLWLPLAHTYRELPKRIGATPLSYQDYVRIWDEERIRGAEGNITYLVPGFSLIIDDTEWVATFGHVRPTSHIDIMLEDRHLGVKHIGVDIDANNPLYISTRSDEQGRNQIVCNDLGWDLLEDAPTRIPRRWKEVQDMIFGDDKTIESQVSKGEYVLFENNPQRLAQVMVGLRLH